MACLPDCYPYNGPLLISGTLDLGMIPTIPGTDKNASFQTAYTVQTI